MDPENFNPPWKINEENLAEDDVVYVLTDNHGKVVGLIGDPDHAEFITRRVNRFFEGL